MSALLQPGIVDVTGLLLVCTADVPSIGVAMFVRAGRVAAARAPALRGAPAPSASAVKVSVPTV